MASSSSGVPPSTPGATGRAWSCFSTDSLSSAWSLGGGGRVEEIVLDFKIPQP